MEIEIHKSKVKDSEIVATPLCLRITSKDWSVDNLKKTELNVYVYDFSVDYDAIAVDDILDIHKYLMKENNDIKMVRFITKVFVVAISFFSCNALECASMNNQKCKIKPEIININSNEPLFILIVLKQIKAVAVEIILMIHMQNYVFLMLPKT